MTKQGEQVMKQSDAITTSTVTCAKCGLLCLTELDYVVDHVPRCVGTRPTSTADYKAHRAILARALEPRPAAPGSEENPWKVRIEPARLAALEAVAEAATEWEKSLQPGSMNIKGVYEVRLCDTLAKLAAIK